MNSEAFPGSESESSSTVGYDDDLPIPRQSPAAARKRINNPSSGSGGGGGKMRHQTNQGDSSGNINGGDDSSGSSVNIGNGHQVPAMAIVIPSHGKTLQAEGQFISFLFFFFDLNFI